MLQYRVNITFVCTEEEKYSYDLLYFAIFLPIFVVVWNQIHSMSKVCMYTEQMTHMYIYPLGPAYMQKVSHLYYIN